MYVCVCVFLTRVRLQVFCGFGHDVQHCPAGNVHLLHVHTHIHTSVSTRLLNSTMCVLCFITKHIRTLLGSEGEVCVCMCVYVCVYVYLLHFLEVIIEFGSFCSSPLLTDFLLHTNTHRHTHTQTHTDTHTDTHRRNVPLCEGVCEL